MRFRCEITTVANCGDHLRVELQGQEEHAPDYWPMRAITLQIAANTVSMKAYHVGRIVTVEVKPS